jgi:hypothetical protein
MEAFYLVCGARRPQLKRNPLGGATNIGAEVGLVKLLLFPAAILATAPLACRGEPAPLRGLSGITRVEVHAVSRHLAESGLIIMDSLRLKAIAKALDNQDHGWHGSDWGTPPAGDLQADFFRGDSLVGVLWVGSEFIAERGAGERLLKNISSSTEAQIRHLLDSRISPLKSS